MVQEKNPFTPKGPSHGSHPVQRMTAPKILSTMNPRLNVCRRMSALFPVSTRSRVASAPACSAGWRHGPKGTFSHRPLPDS
jgi:hypothetical protein